MDGEQAISCRELETTADYEQCIELQRLTWGNDFQELVPAAVIKISQKVGAVAAGAFDQSDRLLGFVFGLSGFRFGERAHWSHMLAVRPEARGLGLGKHLKLFQRDLLLELGVQTVYWTYDPLVARNANLNMNRLGARPVEYVVDMYGSNTGSQLHSGLGTDRFVVGWKIGDPVVETAISEAKTPKIPGPRGGDALLNSDIESATPLDSPKDLGADEIWVEVPADIDRLRRDDFQLAEAWRDTVRALFPEALASGYSVSGFSVEGDGAERRSFYRLTRDQG